MASQSLSFYTTGEGFTGLLNSFFEEGRFKALYETLEDGGLPHEQIVLFFMGLGYFEGDTRGDGTLSYHVKENVDKVIEHRIYWALCNAASNLKQTKTYFYKSDNDDDDDEVESTSPLSLIELFDRKVWDKDENIKFLCKVFKREQLLAWVLPHLLSKEGFPVNPDPNEYHGNGAIIKTGEYVTCEYMEHDQLFPILYRLELVESSQWTQDDTTLHVSSGSISGFLAHAIERDNEGNKMTAAQLMTLIKYKKSIKQIYSRSERLFETIRKYIGDVESYGGKYNNLSFLKLTYPQFNFPKFGKEQIDGVKNCLRTSPVHSLPGLLESKFNITPDSVREMQETFEQYKNIRGDNEFHYFYQEYIDGTNGVFHISRSGFSYAIGDERGDVVRGKASGKLLPAKTEKKLTAIAKEIFDDMDIPMQVEFVVTPAGKIYLVQLRKIENECERTVRVDKPAGVLVIGKTFSQGRIADLTASDILVVEDDADSKELLGKKALIVKNRVEFSHILALASSLRIPALYATGDFKLPDGVLAIQAYNEEGYIYKP